MTERIRIPRGLREEAIEPSPIEEPVAEPAALRAVPGAAAVGQPGRGADAAEFAAQLHRRVPQSRGRRGHAVGVGC